MVEYQQDVDSSSSSCQLLCHPGAASMAGGHGKDMDRRLRVSLTEPACGVAIVSMPSINFQQLFEKYEY